MRKSCRFIGTSPLWAALFAMNAIAADDRDTQLTAPNVDVSAFRVPTLLSETTQGVSVVTAADIAAINPGSVVDLMNQVPGLHVDQVGGPGGTASAYIRGSDQNHVLVLIDGIRQNDPTTSRGGAVDLSSISAANIERIEVIRGGGSALYGSDAIGGVINIVTKRGQTGGVFVDGDVGLGTRGYRTVGSSVSGGDDTVRFRAGISNLKDGIDTEGGRVDLTTLSGNLDVRLAANADLRFTAIANNRGSSSFPDTSGGIRLAVLRDLDQKHADDTTVGANLKWRPTDMLDLNLQLSNYMRSEDVVSVGVSPGNQVPATSSHTQFSRNAALVSGTLRLPLTSAITAGYEYLGESGSNSTVIPAFFTTAQFNQDRNTNSGFAELKSSPVDSLVLRAGVRYDDITAFGGHTSPSGGVRFTLEATGTVFKANATRGFKAPSFFALSNPLAGNPNLQPEESVNAEAGVEQPLFGDRVVAGLTWFRNHVRNLIDFDPTIFKLVNRSAVTVNGSEAFISMKPIDTLSIGLQSTYAPTRNDATGERIRNRPDWRGGITVNWMANEKVSLGWRTLYVGTSLDSSAPTGFVVLEPFWRTDINGSYALNDKVKFTAAIDNLFDKRYEQYIGFTNPGIRFRIGVNAKF